MLIITLNVNDLNAPIQTLIVTAQLYVIYKKHALNIETHRD